MIRVLLIGRDAADWVTRLEPLLPGADIEGARLPAAGIRAFERSPADVIVLCGDVDAGRLAAVVATLRAEPLGGVLPFIAVTNEPLDAVDVYLNGAGAADLVRELLLAVGLRPQDLQVSASHQPPTDRENAPIGLSATEIERKRREVRHETYFKVLGVSPDANSAAIAAAFAAQWRRFDVSSVPAELEQQCAEDLAEVRDGLEDAYAVLGNERLRAAYSEPRRLRES